MSASAELAFGVKHLEIQYYAVPSTSFSTSGTLVFVIDAFSLPAAAQQCGARGAGRCGGERRMLAWMQGKESFSSSSSSSSFVRLFVRSFVCLFVVLFFKVRLRCNGDGDGDGAMAGGRELR